jgi:hypothetical protein
MKPTMDQNNAAPDRARLLDDGLQAVSLTCPRDPAQWPPAVSPAAEVLLGLLHDASRRGGPSEPLEEACYSPCIGGIYTEAQGTRTGAKYVLSITAGQGLTLRCQLPEPSLLNRVTDTFWGHFADLCRLPGKGRFSENVCATSGLDPEVGRSLRSRSALFQLIRNFVLLESDPNGSCQVSDIGGVKYSPRSRNLGDDVPHELALAFGHLYAMNCEVYRLRYVSARAGKNRQPSP